MHMFSGIIKHINTFGLNFVDAFCRDYLNEKFGDSVLLCTVSGDSQKSTLSFSYTDNNRKKLTIVPNVSHIIRKQCGEYLLMRKGRKKYNVLDQDNINIDRLVASLPQVLLFLAPSAIKALGIQNTIRFLRDWPGVSLANDIPVVRYTTRLKADTNGASKN